MFGRSWLFNEFIVTTDNSSSDKACALVSARGLGVELASSRFYYGTAVFTLSAFSWDSGHTLSV